MSLLVVVLAFLPVAYRVVPDLTVRTQVLIGLLMALMAGAVDYYRNARPRPRIEDKRTAIFDAVFDMILTELRDHDPTARFLIMEIDIGSWPGGACSGTSSAKT